jgi:glycosyltransferase involved in cell wall biosynthesis
VKIMTVHNRYRSATPSGENKVVDREAEALSAIGHKVIRFERSSDEIENWSKLKKARLPAQIIWNGQSRHDLAGALNQNKPDVVHVHNTFPLLSASILRACYDARVPVVATLHNKRLVCASGDFFRNGAPCHDCAGGSSFQAVVHGCYRNSRAASVPVVVAGKAQRKSWESLVSAYVFVSASLRDLLAGMEFPPERVFVRHHLIPGKIRREVSREPVIFYAGRLDEAKGARVLMDAWDGYLGSLRSPALRLLIAGAGPLDGEVTAWAASRPSVELAGHVDSARCLDLMSRARAVVLPSICEETFGLVAVEAMALGVPPVAAAHGAFPEIITHGVDGVLTKPGDPAELAVAIAAADEHPAQYERYGEQARKAYESRFDPEANIDQLLEIYQYSMAHPVWERSLLRCRRSGGGITWKKQWKALVSAGRSNTTKKTSGVKRISSSRALTTGSLNALTLSTESRKGANTACLMSAVVPLSSGKR